MKRILFAAAAIVLAAVSCRKEEFVAPSEGTTVLTVSLDNSSKTGLAAADAAGSRKIYWLKGDQLSWNGVASEALGEEYTAEVANTSAIFTWKGTLNKPCNILYPASMYDMYDDETYITLPATQADSKAEDAIATDVLPMYARVEAGEKTPTLKSLTGLVKISWNLPAKDADSHKMKIIEFRGNNGEQVSGKFSIDYATGTLTPASTKDADTVVTVIANRTATAETPCCCLIAVPAGTYAGGFTVTLVDQYGHYMEKSKTSSAEIKAGNSYALPVFEFIPSGTRMSVITTADEWNAYAKAYNGGDYTDAIIAADLDFSKTSLTNITKSFRNVIDGQNHTIRGLKDCSESLVETVASDGVVKNIVIGSTCEYIVTDFKDNEIFYCAPLVKTLNGTVQNCVNNASISFDEFEGDLPLGGYVGGLVAFANSASKAKILDCTNNGSITVPDTFKDGSNPGISSNRIAIGGIAGYGNAKEISGCTNTADITVNSALGGCLVGGISGGVTANYGTCINSGNITKANGSAAVNCNEYLAGINAYSWTEGAKYHGCKNSGNIKTTGPLKTRYLGGITAYNTKSIDFKTCSNSGNLIVEGAYIYYNFTVIGGLIGYSKYAQTLKLSGCDLNGEIALKYSDVATGVATKSAVDNIAVGGLIGLCGEGADIDGEEFSFSPNIHVNFNKLSRENANSGDYVGIGGLVGVNREVNKGTSGPVKISGCTVNADGIVRIDDNNNTQTNNAFAINNVGVGGILGESFIGVVTISDCIVKGIVGVSPKGRNTGSNSNGSVSVGGIVGEIKSSGESSISKCEFSEGKLYANVYNSSNETSDNGVFAGGILGRFVSDGSVQISECKVAISEASLNRAIIGGIAGKVINATISKCSFISEAVLASAKSSAGIVGFIKGGTVEYCTVKATGTNAISCSYTSSSNEFAGGIAAVADGTSFNNCKSFANICASKKPNTSNLRNKDCAIGGFVAKVLNNCTFTGCSCGGQLYDTQGGVIRTGTPAEKTINLDGSNVNDYAIQCVGEDDYVPDNTFTYWDGTEESDI